MAVKGIDRITGYEKGVSLTAERDVKEGEALFEDHFPDYPVYPGVMMLEGLVQTAAWYVLKEGDFTRSQAFVTAVHSVKFSRLVRPATSLRFEARCERAEGGGHDFKGTVTEAGKAVATARYRLQTGPVSGTSHRQAGMEEALNAHNRRMFEGLRTAKIEGCKSGAKYG